MLRVKHLRADTVVWSLNVVPTSSKTMWIILEIKLRNLAVNHRYWEI